MNRRSLSGSISERSLGLVLAWAGIVLSVLLLGLRMFAEQIYLVAIPLGLGVGSLVYVLSHEGNHPDRSLPTLPSPASQVLPAVVLLGLASLVFRSTPPSPRSEADFVLAAIVGTAILGQVFFVGDDDFSPTSVLTQVVLATLVVRLTVLFGTPGFIGVDAWTHVPVYVQNVAAAGSLSAMSGTKYVLAPIYHLVGAVGTVLFGDPRTAVFLVIGTVVALSVTFVYATAAIFVPARWATLAAALYAFSDEFIRWGIHLIPTSLGLVFFLAALYLLSLTLLGDREPWVLASLAGFSLAVVFTHQVSNAILLVVLATGVAVAVLAHVSTRRAPNPVPVAVVFVLTLVVTLLSWTQTPLGEERVFLYRRLDLLSVAAHDVGFLQVASEHVSSGATGVPVTASPSVLAPVVEAGGFTLLFAVAVVGGLAMLDWDRPQGITYLHIVAAGLLFVAVFGLQMIGYRILLPGRWTAFLFVPMVILGAIGVKAMYDRTSRNVVIAAVLLLALAYPATMVVAENSAMDGPPLEDSFIRYAYTESEVSALETIEEIRPPDHYDDIRTDHPYVSVFKVPGGYDSRILGLNESGPAMSEPVVYRTYQSDGRVTFHLGPEGENGSVTGTVPESFVCQSDWDRVFTNDEVAMCVPNDVPGRGTA